MTLEADLRAFVLADADVATLVGVRMYPRRLPQKPTLPALVYQRIATRRLHDLVAPDGVPRVRMQVTCWAAQPADAYRLAQAVRKRLDGHRGAMGDGTVGSVLCVGERDIEDPDAGRSGVALDFAVQLYEVD